MKEPAELPPKGSISFGGWLAPAHQRVIGALCLLAANALAIGAGWLRWQERLVDIDHAGPRRAEFRIDVNEAVESEMMAIPTVGPKLAEAMVDHRRQAGRFESHESLLEVHGLGPKKLAKIQKYLLPID
jgi:competence ComEA-like helix-hairpin-helix protein